jgi:hypothetical protein
MNANEFAIATIKDLQKKVKQLESEQEDSYPGQGRDKFLVGTRKIKPTKLTCNLCSHNAACHAVPNKCPLQVLS